MAEIGPVDFSSPSSRFYWNADVVSQSQSSNQTVVKLQIRNYNGPSGNSGSNFGGSGEQVISLAGVGGSERKRSANSNFLPSGYNAHQLRWDQSWNVTLQHNSNGYYTGTSTNVTVQARITYGNINQSYSVNLSIPRILQPPGQVAQPTITDLGARQARINWSAPSSMAAINDYDLHVCTSQTRSAAACTAHYNWTGNTTTNKLLTGLARGATLHASVRAKSSAGTGSWSAWRTFTTNAFEPPTAPSTYSVTDLTSQSAYTSLPSVSDNGGSPLTNLRVEYNTSASSTGSTVVTVGAYRPAFMGGLARATTYHYRIAVANSAAGGGWGPYGAWRTFTTLANTPDAPTGLSFTDLSPTSGLLEWTAPAELGGSVILSYAIRVAYDAGFATGLRSISVPADETQHLLTGLEANRRYYVQVWPVSSNGLGGYTEPITFIKGVEGVGGGAWFNVPGVGIRRGTLWFNVPGVGIRRGTIWVNVPVVGIRRAL